MSQQYTISRGSGKTEYVDGQEVVPGLFLHRIVDGEGFAVSHVLTGLGFGFKFRTEEGARNVLHSALRSLETGKQKTRYRMEGTKSFVSCETMPSLSNMKRFSPRL